MCTSFGDHGPTVGRACDDDCPTVGRLRMTLLRVSGVDFGNYCPHTILRLRRIDNYLWTCSVDVEDGSSLDLCGVIG